jgi:hypothetical protein
MRQLPQALVAAVLVLTSMHEEPAPHGPKYQKLPARDRGASIRNNILAAPTRFSDFLLRMAHHPHVEGLAVALTDPRAAAPPARQGIDRIGDSFELGCESPRFVWRKHRVRAVEIDMHPVIKSKDRPSGDERDARFGRQIVGSPKGVHVQSPFPS